jgi:UDP-N-acetylmuramoylalanine--D-glutamate ligase
MMDWSGQRVVILGAARQGVALARYLVRHGATVVVNDRLPENELQEARQALEELPIEWVYGGHPIEVLEGADLICPSGGVPLILPILVEARRRGIPLSNDSQIFLEAANCKTIGITGSAGKTTTTTLVGRIASATIQEDYPRQPFRVWVGGNIGSPLIAHVDEMNAADIAIMELSSFQLELMTGSPQVAAVMNITPNHLDRHSSMQEYTEAKARILRFQSAKNVAVLNRDDPGSWRLLDRIMGDLVTFGCYKPNSEQAEHT